MNYSMAYLLGMIVGNGRIQRDNVNTTVSIRLPHKKLETEKMQDVRVYVAASVTNIRAQVEPLVSVIFDTNQKEHVTTMSFTKPNQDYLITEIMRLVNNEMSCRTMRIHEEIFNASDDIKRIFIQGIADVTGYIRQSNNYFHKYEHRVYIEVPYNWFLVVDICNLLKILGIPVQNIDWAHPNMRDGNLKKYKAGNTTFWKKEHQIKIWAINFLSIGFGIIHKREALEYFSDVMLQGIIDNERNLVKYREGFYWESVGRDNRERLSHPSEHDEFIPLCIRGKHYNSWKEIAFDLGYRE